MTSTAVERRGLVPAPGALLGFLVLGALAVFALPEVADNLPHPGRVEQARYATTCFGVLVLTGLYVYAVASSRPQLDRTWVAWTLLYAMGVVIVKFILSPNAFQKSTETTLNEFVTTGMLVMPLYLAAFGLMYHLARRRREGWSLSSKLAVAMSLAVAAVATRFLVSLILGSADEYLDGLIGAGLILPVVVAVASFAVMESFDRAGPSLKSALGLGIALVIAHHLLWMVFMFRVF